jgi:hypothetical protein
MIAQGERWLVQRIGESPAILGLGDVDIRSASCRSGQARLLLEDPAESIFYVVELQLGPTDDLHVIRLVERWAAERRRQPKRRCFAVLVAELIDLRYRNFLGLIRRAVPLAAIEMQLSTVGPVALRFTRLRLGWVAPPRRTQQFFHLLNELCGRHIQRRREAEDGSQRRVHLPALQHADVGSVITALKSQGFLRYPALRPGTTKCLGERFIRIEVDRPCPRRERSMEEATTHAGMDADAASGLRTEIATDNAA